MEATQLAHELASLDSATWFNVLEQAKSLRRQKDEEEAEEPLPGASKEAFASWVATRHLNCDPGIMEVLYLCPQSSDDVIRLLEIDALFVGPDFP